MRQLLLVPGALLLAGCGMLEGQVREEFVQRCEAVAEDSRLPAALASESCECAADKALEDGVTKLDEIDQARVREIVAECARERMPSIGADPAVNEAG